MTVLAAGGVDCDKHSVIEQVPGIGKEPQDRIHGAAKGPLSGLPRFARGRPVRDLMRAGIRALRVEKRDCFVAMESTEWARIVEAVCSLTPVVVTLYRRARPRGRFPRGGAVNNSTIVGRVVDRRGLTRSRDDGALDTLLEAIGEALARDEPVRITGFGTFTTKGRVAGTGRNPRKGESLTILGSTGPGLRAGKRPKVRLNGGNVGRDVAVADARIGGFRRGWCGGGYRSSSWRQAGRDVVTHPEECQERARRRRVERVQSRSCNLRDTLDF